MKTTIELPDELLREAKATAARQGKSLKQLFTEALRDRLYRTAGAKPGHEDWRTVFGKAEPSEVRRVDEVVSEELERIDVETWR